jgi:hypothetical protein
MVTFSRRSRTNLPKGHRGLAVLLGVTLALGTLVLSPAVARAAVPEVRTPLPVGQTLNGTKVALGNSIVWDTKRSTNGGTTWVADPALGGGPEWQFVGGGKMARYSSAAGAWTATVYDPSTGAQQTYPLPSEPESLNATYAVLNTSSVINFTTGVTTALVPPTGDVVSNQKATLSPDNRVVWSSNDWRGDFAVASSPLAAPGPWVFIDDRFGWELAGPDFLFLVADTSGIRLCSLPLSTIASSPTCVTLATGNYYNSYGTLHVMGSLVLATVGTISIYGNEPGYTFVVNEQSVAPLKVPDGYYFDDYQGDYIDGDTPYVVIRDADSVPWVRTLHADGSLTAAFAVPVTRVVQPEFLSVTPDRVVGGDSRDGSIDLPVWSRTVSKTGFGTETPIAGHASVAMASAGRTVTASLDGVTFYDRGHLGQVVSDPNVLGPSGDPLVAVSGPYVAYYTGAGTTIPYLIGRADGTLTTIEAKGALYGSQFVTEEPTDPGWFDPLHLARRDVTGATPPQAYTLEAGTASCRTSMAGIWASRIALSCNDSSLGAASSRIYDYKTGALVGKISSGTIKTLGDGYAIVADVDTYSLWNLSTGTFTALTDCVGPVATDGVGHVACASGTELIWRDFSSLSTSSPRLLGVLAPGSVDFSGASSWEPQLDLTKPVAAGTLEIRNADNQVIRALASPASVDGSIRGLIWDGLDTAGRPAPVGDYSYRLLADSVDGSGAATLIDAPAAAGGTVTVTGTAQAAGAFTPLTPRRVLDTRDTGPKLGPAQTRSLNVTAAEGGVPANVAAVVLNVTVTETTSSGYLTVFPAGTTRPSASNLNWSAGSTIANAVTVKVGAGGYIDLYQSGPGSGQVIVDVAGWFRSGTVTEPGGFSSLPPMRLLDTRNTGGKLVATEARDLEISGVGGVPNSNVSAVVLNVTVTETTASGYLTVYPSGTARPTASNLNWGAGATIPNLVTVQVGGMGKVSLYQSGPGTAQVIVDVAGYYQGGTPTEPGMFVALAPSRVLDTRPAPISSNSNYSLALLGKGGIPVTGVWAVVLNTTVTETTAPGFLTVYPGPTTMPLASNLNWTAGVTIPNHVTVPIGNDGKVRFYNGSGGTTQVIADTAGYYLT